MSCKGRFSARIVPLTAALALLSGCAGMLERDYTTAVTHVENPAPQWDAAYRVESYPALCAALLSYVEEGMEEGLLRFPTTYGGNLTVDLGRAKERLLTEEPVGAYAVEDITFRASRIISYYEVEIEVAYRQDREELRALREVDGTGELDGLLKEAMEDRTERVTALVEGCPLEQESYLAEALERAYVACPALALGRPGVSVTTWPETGDRRVVELKLTYPEKTSGLSWIVGSLRRRAESLAAAAQPTYEGVYDALQSCCVYDPEVGNTVADALMVGRAGQEGMTLGFRLLCDEKDLPCQVEHSEGLWYVSWQSGGKTVYLDVTGPEFSPGEDVPQPGIIRAGTEPGGGPETAQQEEPAPEGAASQEVEED